MNNAVAVFLYAALTPEIQTHLRQTAEAIRSSASRQIEEIVATGLALVSANAALPHGQFGVWQGTEFNWSARTAQRYVSVAEVFGANTTCVTHLPAAVIYRLAALPPQVRKCVLEAGAKGEDEIVDLIVQEAWEAKKAATEALKSPEAKAREKTQQAARNRRWECDKYKRAAAEAEQQGEAEELAREIVDAAPEILERLDALMKLPNQMLVRTLTEAKKDVTCVHAVRKAEGEHDA
jgi:hypothetical protein